jgi:hypothetical protein
MTFARSVALRSLRAAGLLLLFGAGGAAAAPALDLGEPSVLSQQGQRLKVALPYGSAPGERVSPTRFEVVSVQVPAGFTAPAVEGFTLSSPGQRNLVFLQSRERVDAPEVVLTVRLADRPDDAPQAWRIRVPPSKAAAPEAPALQQPGPRPAAATAALRRPVRPTVQTAPQDLYVAR